jgi:hypothetical protein
VFHVFHTHKCSLLAHAYIDESGTLNDHFLHQNFEFPCFWKLKNFHFNIWERHLFYRVMFLDPSKWWYELDTHFLGFVKSDGWGWYYIAVVADRDCGGLSPSYALLVVVRIIFLQVQGIELENNCDSPFKSIGKWELYSRLLKLSMNNSSSKASIAM